MKDRLEFKGAIIGMLMGDASLTHDRKNALLRISVTERHEEFALWKKAILEELTGVTMWRGDVRIGEKGYRGLRLWTKSHPFYTSLRERMYHQGRKTFDIHCLKRLTLKGLLIWYLDDGSLTWTKETPSMYFCTDRYNLIEQLALQKYLHDRWGLVSRLNRHSRQWRLRLTAQSARDFVKLMEPLASEVPMCMRYKLDLSHEAPVN